MCKLITILALILGSAAYADETTLTTDTIIKGYANPWIFGVKWKNGVVYDSTGATMSVTVLKADGSTLFTKTATPTPCPIDPPGNWTGYACFQATLTAADTAAPGLYKIRVDTVKGAGHDPAIGTLVIRG